jgi:IS30 family transposase
LRAEDRRTIENCLRQGLSQKVVAAVVGCSPATVCRELRRAGCDRDGGHQRLKRPGRPGPPRQYLAGRAQEEATVRAALPKPFKLVGELALVVGGWLEADWSPQQISALLPVMFPDDRGMRVSHETIYQSLFVQGRGELRRELAAHLRSKQKTRKSRTGPPERRGRLTGMVSISERPAEASDRAVPGHWEGDLLLGGTSKGAVITLVERTSRFVLLAPLPDTHRALDVRQMLTAMIGSLPLELRKSLTWDQGKEMAHHAEFSLETNMAVYFCDPHSPWQRGTNENTNGLLRQYWPKGADLRGLTQTDCDAVALKLNTRPRETLGWKTPAQALNERLIAAVA